MPGWVTLDEFKDEMDRVEDEDDINAGRDDTRLQRALDAAVAFVERVRKGHFNFDGDPVSELPAPTPDVKLGTLRLAHRWYLRRRSPEGMLNMAEQGAARVSSYDPDIDRLLRIGRHARPVVG